MQGSKKTIFLSSASNVIIPWLVSFVFRFYRYDIQIRYLMFTV